MLLKFLLHHQPFFFPGLSLLGWIVFLLLPEKLKGREVKHSFRSFPIYFVIFFTLMRQTERLFLFENAFVSFLVISYFCFIEISISRTAFDRLENDVEAMRRKFLGVTVCLVLLNPLDLWKEQVSTFRSFMVDLNGERELLMGLFACWEEWETVGQTFRVGQELLAGKFLMPMWEIKRNWFKGLFAGRHRAHFDWVLL